MKNYRRLIQAAAQVALIFTSLMPSWGQTKAISFLVDCSNTTGPVVSRMLYGMNVARWDHQLFPDAASEMLLTSDRVAIQKLKELRPSFLKYPGGNDADSYIWNSPANPARDMDTEEFLALSRAVGAPGFFTVNFTQPPALAAEWVRHTSTNSTGTLPVTMWEVGDEVWGPWAKSHSTGKAYGEKFREFAKAMKAENPRVQLAANLALSSSDSTWTQEALSSLGDSFDLITITFFPLSPPSETDDALLKSPDQYRRMFRKLEENVQRFREGKPRPPYCLVGFNSTSGRPGPQTVEMVNGVFMAQMFGALAETGTDMACWWAFHNEYPKRGGDFGILTSNRENRPHPTYWVMKMLSHDFHGKLLSVERKESVELYAVFQPPSAVVVLAVNTSPMDTAEIDVSINNWDFNKPLLSVDMVTSGTEGIAQLAKSLPLSGERAQPSRLVLPPYSVAIQKVTSTQ